MLYAAEAFLQDGYAAVAAGFEEAELPGKVGNPSVKEAISGADIIVLPIRPAEGERLHAPYAKDEIALETLFELIGNRPVFSGGCDALRPYMRGRLTDYSSREDFAVRNAVLTAEGAMALLIGASPDSVFGAKALVLGYGRIGRILARYLRALGAFVTVAARRAESRAWAAAEGCDACNMTMSGIGSYRFILNTIPAPVLNAEHIAALDCDTVLIDLASAPGGFDKTAAQARGLRLINAPGLPGKMAPAAAGRIIEDTILSILKEENGGKDNSRLCDDRFLLHL